MTSLSIKLVLIGARALRCLLAVAGAAAAELQVSRAWPRSRSGRCSMTHYGVADLRTNTVLFAFSHLRDLGYRPRSVPPPTALIAAIIGLEVRRAARTDHCSAVRRDRHARRTLPRASGLTPPPDSIFRRQSAELPREQREESAMLKTVAAFDRIGEENAFAVLARATR